MNCKVCSVEFESKREGAKYCSAKCRKAASRLSSVTDNVTLSDPKVREDVTFKFTIKLGPNDAERGLVEQKNKVRGAVYWYDVPLAAVPVRQKDWPEMSESMNGRQYFLWWKNEFQLNEDPEKGEIGQPVILNPFPDRTGMRYEMGGEGSRRWGA